MVIPNGFILKNFLAGRTNFFKTLLKKISSTHEIMVTLMFVTSQTRQKYIKHLPHPLPTSMWWLIVLKREIYWWPTRKCCFWDYLTYIIKLIFLKIPCWMCRSICRPVTADDSLFIIRNANFWSFARCLPAFLIPINIGAAFVFSKTFRSICLISKWVMFND